MSDAPGVFQIPTKQADRFKKINDVFQAKYGCKPEFYARAPGRVNLIGEHIDYCGYAVLPMAVEQDIVIAVATNSAAEIKLCNSNTEYGDFQCGTALSDIVIEKSAPKWFHYFLCGYRGILEHLQLNSSKGLCMVLDGTVPRSAGLSSSSALVCCSALATAHANGKQCTKLELAEVCQHCERYIGTEGGGMDQSISFLAQAGTAKLIEFNPIRATDVKLPDGAVFVISNSCVEMNKAATEHYNVRVAECRLGAQIIAKTKGLNWKEVRRLGDLQNQLAVSMDGMVAMVKEMLHTGPYSKSEVCELLGVTSGDLNKISLSEKTIALQSFELHKRALHVYSEASRVWKFKDVCDHCPDDALKLLGDLMNQSHSSCSELYECSCSELDQLTTLCRQSGALGSRLTGAGWGGCAVSLVPADHVTQFLDKVKTGYYTGIQTRVSESLFATEPGSGAAIYS